MNSPYAKRGLGRQRLPKYPYFSTRRGHSPRLVEKRELLGGPGTITQKLPGALQTSRKALPAEGEL
jgi:hypothetical protein